jgi:hypothetical protein
VFAVQQGSKSDTSKDWQPAQLPGVSTPLDIEGSITFCSFLSTQPYIVNATEITFKVFVENFSPASNLNVYLAFYFSQVRVCVFSVIPVCIPQFGQSHVQNIFLVFLFIFSFIHFSRFFSM